MKTLVSIALLALGACHVARAQDSLTLAEAQRRALELAPQIIAADAAVRASREMAHSAGRRPDPVLKLQVQNVPITGSEAFSLNDDFMTMRSASLMQEFTGAEKLERRSERFAREAERGLAERASALATVQTQTALAWIDRYYAERVVDAIAEQREEAVRGIEASEAAYRGGRGSRTDVLSARTEVVALEDRLSAAQRTARVATEALARWIGPSASAPLSGSLNLRSVPPHLAASHLALDAHPDITMASRAIDVARADLRVAEADRHPDWTWELMYSRRGPAYSDMVSVGVSVPLPWDRANKQDREVAAKRALVDEAQARRDDMVRMHLAEVRSMMLEWQDDLSRLDRYDREWLPLVDERKEAALTAYAGGRGNLTDVFAARRSELDTRLQRVQLEADTARVWARLSFLVPVDLPARSVP